MKRLLPMVLLGVASMSAIAAPAAKPVVIEGSSEVKETRVIRSATKSVSNTANTANTASSPRYAKLTKPNINQVTFNNPFLSIPGNKNIKAAGYNTDGGSVTNYVDLASISKMPVTIDGKPRNVITAFSTTVFSEGIPFTDEVTAYSSTEQIYVICKPIASYQNRLAAFDQNGEGVFGRSYDKKELKLSDFKKPTPKTVNEATIKTVCTANDLISKKG